MVTGIGGSDDYCQVVSPGRRRIDSSNMSTHMPAAHVRVTFAV